MKLYCYWTSFCISFIWFPVFWFLKWTETWTLDFCIFNLRWPPGALIRLFASFKYFGSLIQLLQNFQEKNWMATNLTHLKYNWPQHNWLVFVVFLIYNFHFSSHGEEINWFLVFRLIFYVRSSLLFSVVFSNVSRYSTRMEILLYMHGFVNKTLFFQFSHPTLFIGWPKSTYYLRA